MSTLSFDVAPMFPWPLLGGLAGVAALIVAFGLYRRARGMGWRTLAIAALLLALLNPVVIVGNSLDIALEPDENGIGTVTVRATDPSGATITDTVTVSRAIGGVWPSHSCWRAVTCSPN